MQPLSWHWKVDNYAFFVAFLQECTALYVAIAISISYIYLKGLGSPAPLQLKYIRDEDKSYGELGIVLALTQGSQASVTSLPIYSVCSLWSWLHKAI